MYFRYSVCMAGSKHVPEVRIREKIDAICRAHEITAVCLSHLVVPAPSARLSLLLFFFEQLAVLPLVFALQNRQNRRGLRSAKQRPSIGHGAWL